MAEAQEEICELVLQGTYLFGNQDMYAGDLNAYGKPNGKGIMYYYDSGEADVGVWKVQPSGPPKQIGKGVRFNTSREMAFSIEDGTKGSGLRIDQALDLVGLEEP